MALEKQLVPLPIDKGLETKVDAKQEEPGFLRKAENIVYETIKKLRKRNGYDKIDLNILGGDSIVDPRVLAKYKSEILLLTPSRLYSYAPSRMAWQDKGAVYASSVESNVIAKSGLSLSQVDGLVVDNFRVFTWKASDGSVRYSVQDLENNSFLLNNAQVAASGERPVLGRIQNVVYIIYGNSANVYYKSFNILNPSTLSSATSLASNRDTSEGLIDATSKNNKIYIAYNADASGNDLSILYIHASGVSSIVGVTGETCSKALHIMVDDASRVVVSYSNGSAVKYTIYPATLLSSLLVPTVIETIADISTCCVVSPSAGSYIAFYEKVQSGSSNNYVKKVTATYLGVVGTPAIFKRSVGLAGCAFYHDDRLFVPTVHESAVQSSYFLFDTNGYLVTKYANQLASSVVSTGVLPESSFVSDDKVLLPFMFRNRVQSDTGTFFTTNGIAAATINFEPDSPYSNAYLAEGLHLCAGVLKLYDGATISEHGFHVFPEVLSAATAGTGGSMSDGDYAYVAVYRWTDNTGREHRSAPTQSPLTSTLSGGGSSQKITVTIPTLRISDKSDVVIDLFRTENAGTSYYKVTSDLSPLLNVTSADTVSFIDTIADTTLIARELLYTTGGTLENIAASAVTRVTALNGERLAIVGELSNRVFMSKQVFEETPVEFNDTIYRDVDPAGGAVTQLQGMNDKLVIFSEGCAAYITGEGPNNLGQQDTFTKPEVIPDLGCSDPSSVVLAPSGILFKSRKGIYRLSPGLATDYIGARVEVYNSKEVSSAQIVGDVNQIRFTLTEDRALVYNYELDRWGTFENHGALSAVAVDSDYYYLREDGALYKENPDSFSDASSPIRMRIETGWLYLADLQGYQRVYYALLLGEFKSSHKLRIKVAYDFVDAWVHESLVDPTDVITTTTYGQDTPYGNGTPYGGSAAGGRYQFEIHFKRQKCQAIKLSIEDVQEQVGEGLAISAITFRAATKQGGAKVRSSRKVATT